MPFTVQSLIEGRHPPLAVPLSETVQRALERMIEHDFSQLPVVDNENVVQGMVTSSSIVRAASNFDVTIKNLRVSDALVKTRRYRVEDDLSDLLNGLRDNYAVLIVDGEDRLIGIVTSYDTTDFFRRRAEDLMLVEDIETTLKDLVLASFVNNAGQTDEKALAAVIEEVTSSRRSELGRFQQGLRHFLKLSGTDQTPNSKWVEEAFLTVEEKKTPKTFTQLTFSDYIALFLHKGRWPLYSAVFGLDADAVSKILNEVREARNTLAHFHSDLTLRQRQLLRFCADWLARHQPNVQFAFVKSDAETKNLLPGEHGPGLTDSRYAPLALWLQRLPLSEDKVSLTFREIEDMIGDSLPESARKHRVWWSNESDRQAAQWLSVGWRVSSINVANEDVTFARIKEWEPAYRNFFSSLLRDLRAADQFSIRATAPSGASWTDVAALPDHGPQAAVFAFSFIRDDRFRVELYIDTGDKDRNKHIFDGLAARKSVIESTLGAPLSWERINYNRPTGQDYQPVSRIAIYTEGNINDSEDTKAKLRQWAVETMTKFHRVIAPYLVELLTQS